jgi:uncharacterized protein
LDIAAKVAFLGSPAAYGGRAAFVERVETHFSWVFLTERTVYKLKKPVRTDIADFSSLAARRQNAEAELALNRRLAPDVYIRVVPLTRQRSGGLAIGGNGVVVDWLVEMRRLPAASMLDRRLLCGDWRRDDLNVLAGQLARFFSSARRLRPSRRAYMQAFAAECRSARQAFEAAGIPALAHRAAWVARCLEAFIARRPELLLARLDEGRLVDGHGDLRPEHISLAPAPRIIDCIEFRRQLRLRDPVDELAFLAMECARLGAPQVGPILFRHYARHTGDRPAPALVAFYRALAALIRARIAILHLREVPVRDPAKWPPRAADYLEIARRHCRRLGGRRGGPAQRLPAASRQARLAGADRRGAAGALARFGLPFAAAGSATSSASASSQWSKSRPCGRPACSQIA